MRWLASIFFFDCFLLIYAMKSKSWRIAVWLIGTVGSLLLVIIQVLLTHPSNTAPPPDQSLHSYVLDLAERFVRPTFLSFFTVCLLGFLYEIIMKADDQLGMERLITTAVRSALFGRVDPLHVPTLSDQQNAIKEQLVDCTKELHKRRVNQLERNQVLEIDEFGKIWELLIDSTFDCGETLLDFTIGSNALLRFQAYQFSNYYSNLFMRRGSRRNCSSKIKILILCDYDDSLTGSADSMAATSRELEGAVKRVLERIRDFSKMERNLPPGEVYKRASNNANADYEFRLTHSKHIAENEKEEFRRPFNVYGNLALSTSFVTAVDSYEIQPLPHLEVSLKAEKISNAKSKFESVWTKAFFDVTRFAETMDSWETFGTGTLLKKWAEIS